MIGVTSLSKRFAGVTAVDNISFTVAKGEILGFLGPNAAGKTTTMRMLTSFIPPTSGQATIAGFDVVRDSIEVRKLIGYLPESVPFYPEMRVNEYLKFRAKIKRVPRAERKKRMEEVLEMCGVREVKRKIIGHLSKGFRQRLALAEAIIHKPPILIMDEPTIGLDPHQIRQTRALIKDLGKDRTIILSTHILPEVEMICNRVIIIHQGRIVAMDTMEGLAQTGLTRGKIILEVRGPGIEIKRVLEKTPGVTQILWQEKEGVNIFSIETREDLRETVASEMTKNNWTIRELRREQMTLEDLFIRVTTGE